MIEIQCTSCQTRYRIDERILPEDTPTFKCSRCGHVFSAEPRQKAARRPGAPGTRPSAAKPAPGESAAHPPADAPGAPSAAAASAPASAPTAANEPIDVAAPSISSTATHQATGPVPPEPSIARQSASEVRHDESAEIGSPAPDAVEPDISVPPGPTPLASEPSAPAAADRAAAQTPQARPRDERAQPRRPEPETPGYDTRDLLRRRFGNVPADEAERQGENLTFDFHDEPPPEARERDHREKWEVGEGVRDDDAVAGQTSRPRRRISIADMDEALERPARLDSALVRPPAADRRGAQDFDRIRPEEASADARRLEEELRGRPYAPHSAGYFIGLFALVVLGFGLITMVIQSAPLASAGLLSTLPIVGAGLEPPISPARRVALSGVQAQYTALKGDRSALVISGNAENLTGGTLGAVQIVAALTGADSARLRTQAVYCGNNLSASLLREMTPREIEFFEKLDAPKNFTLAPQASAPFVIVFVEPPAGASRFQLQVIRAEPAAAPTAAAQSGG